MHIKKLRQTSDGEEEDKIPALRDTSSKSRTALRTVLTLKDVQPRAKVTADTVEDKCFPLNI